MEKISENRKKVLVVDDNDVMLKLMSSFLSSEGHNVYTAKDALSAFDITHKITPDIIFIDLVLPRLSGDNLCRIFRNLPHLKQCYLVIVSAIALEQEFDFSKMGADGCIAKGPFNLMVPYLKDAIAETDRPRRPKQDIEIKKSANLHARQVTKELLALNNHLNIVLDSMSQGVLEIIAGRIVYFNPAALYIMQATEEKLIGSFFHECVEDSAWEKISLLFEEDSGHSVRKVENNTIEMNDRHVIVKCLLVNDQKGHWIILLTDITERKKMEAVIEATNLAENLGYIFSGIRHEIGNPVGSIKMALGVLKRNLDSYDKETVAEFVDRSLEEVGRIEYLLKELKNYSLFESPEIRKIRLDHFIHNFIGLVETDFERRHLQIHAHIEDGIKNAFIDDRALHQIMLNLLTNAADAVEKVDMPKIKINICHAESGVEIRVEDNGIGISESDQKNLFKPFFTSKAKGTGLGLVIVKKMLLKMNCDIRIESFENFGTTVIVTIPKDSP